MKPSSTECLQAENAPPDPGASRLSVLFDRAAIPVAAYEGPEHVCFYANSAMLELLGPRALLGRRLGEAVPEWHVQGLLAGFDQVYQTGEPAVIHELRLPPDRSTATAHRELVLSCALQPLPADDGRAGVLSIAFDVSEFRWRDTEDGAGMRFALDAANVGTWQWDIASGRVEWSDNLEAIHGLPPGSFGGDFESFLKDVDPRDRAAVMARIQEALQSGRDYHVEYRLPASAGRERWVEGKGRVFTDDQGRPLSMTGICMDVTERKRAAQRLELVMGELHHRVKNLLAVVRSLASQTIRHAHSFEAFENAFQGRLAGLAGALDLLVETDCEGAALGDLIVAQLSPWLGQRDRLRLAGDDVRLSSDAALTLGMTLHELATNAAKYGALSSAVGEVEVNWRMETTAGGQQLVLVWQERGGPKVEPPQRRSFGTKLIERAVAHELNGEAKLEFPEAGVRCTLRFPLEPGLTGPACDLIR